MSNNFNATDNQNGLVNNRFNSPTSPKNNSLQSNQLDNILPNPDNLFKSKTHVIKNNYWNDRHENILKCLQLNASKLYKEYQKAHLIYKKKLRIYRIPIIIMSSVSGFLSISNSGYVPADYNKWISLFVGFVNLAVTVISLIENFKQIDVNVNKTHNAYLEFKKLHDEISLVLNTPQNERDDNGYDMSNKFFSRYEMYLNDAPVLNKTMRDYLDINSSDNTTFTFDSSSGSNSNLKSKNKSSKITESEDDEMYTEADSTYDGEIDDLEAQKKKLRFAKLKSKRALRRSASSVLRNIEPKSQPSVFGSILSFFNFGSSSESEDVINSYKDNLNNLKANVKNSGRERAQSSSDEFNKNIYIKKHELHQKSRKKTKTNKDNVKFSKSDLNNIIESNNKTVEIEINSNIGRLEEEMKKIDDMELKPSKLPKLRNIKISEDIDSGSQKDNVDLTSESSLSDNEDNEDD